MTRPEFYESAVSSRILAGAIRDGGNMLREVNLRSVLTALTAMPAVALARPKTHSVFTALKARTEERLGVVALDTGNGKGLPCRADERISMCSTFKLKAVSAVLARVYRKQEMLTQRITYGRKDLLDLAPVTGPSVEDGAVSSDVPRAPAIQYSDSTAVNLQLEETLAAQRPPRSLPTRSKIRRPGSIDLSPWQALSEAC